MNIFQKGKFIKIESNFRTQGIQALENLREFQKSYDSIYGLNDTDTTINTIRDSLVGYLLGFDYINIEKHGFDAKNTKGDYLEIKSSSISSKTLAGTWNDTNEEKAKAFASEKVYTALAIWEGAADLKFILYSNNNIGDWLLERVQQRKAGSRSTQTLSINKLFFDFNFEILIPPYQNKQEIYKYLCTYNRNFLSKLKLEDVKEIG